MKVVVTGGTGFIGANLVRELLARDVEVHCIIRKPNVCLEGLPVTLHTLPLEDTAATVEKLAKVMDGAQGVYHLAGIFDPSPGGRDRMYNLHIFGTRGLMRAAQKAGVQRFLLCSSSVTVGFGSRDQPGDEETYFDPTTVYGTAGPLLDYYNSKYQAEDLVLGWRGMECVVVNPDYIIGPWDIKPTSGALILRMAKTYVPFYPKGGKCFLGAKDCAVAHIVAMEKGRSGQRYLLGYHNQSYQEIMTTIAEVVGRKAPVVATPTTLLGMAGRLGKWASRIDKHRFAGLDANVLRSMQQERYRSGKKMQQELGIEPQDIRISIEEAYKWFQQHGYC